MDEKPRPKGTKIIQPGEWYQDKRTQTLRKHTGTTPLYITEGEELPLRGEAKKRIE